MTSTCSRGVALLLGAAWLAQAACADARPRIAIIIDDLGYRHALDERAMALPPEVTIAVVPGAPRAKRLAREALTQARDVIVHLPMAPERGEHPLAPYHPLALDEDASRETLRRTVARAFAEIPEARGINNHMGSLLTQRDTPMRWLMQALQCQRGAFFIDSFTTPHSVALQMAQAHDVPAARRDVFLDDDAEPDSIAAEFRRLIALAHRNGAALAIGHPQPETLALLERELARLDEHGVRLVSATDLLSRSAAGSRSGDH